MRNTLTCSLALFALFAPTLADAQSGNGRPPPLGAPRATPTPAPTPGGGHAASPADRNKLMDKLMTLPMAFHTFTWASGDPPKRLGERDAYFCLLTGVSGKFAGPGERVALYVDDGAPGGPQWTLSGTSGQTELKARATCVSYVDIAISPLAPREMFSIRAYPALHSTGCAPKNQLLTGDKAHTMAPFVSGVSGRFSGGAEEAKVDPGFLGASTLSVKACSDGGIDATAMGVVAPLGAIKYRTRNARSDDPAAALFSATYKGPESHWYDSLPLGAGEDLSAGPGTFWLLPADEAMCGITRVGGKFQGYGEEVTLHIEKRPDGARWWTLSVFSQAKDQETSGSIRCIARDQR